MALGSALALGALAVLAVGGAAILWRVSQQPKAGSDEWFYRQGIIPLITDANRKAWETATASKNLTGGKYGDVVGYFVPDAPPPGTTARTGPPPTPGPDRDGKRFEIDRLPELPASKEPLREPTPVYMTPDGLISSLRQPVRIDGGRS